ncbi:acetyl-CoA C-acyltransferase [Arthrobacter sp. Sa2CUA1]|uniref:Probable acetyl-CoA acetyltransferase n=1 Tax=Arthrobacter gallicola TaxID=2762225 RepID=A0ABR8UR37_9MICC|nr:acetyl-CoA C-acyltransferase [Arthrobacter gallicola]MBD7995020.1 acetyl-CoA C-acyltransferase [Arthrobacter gallicola]
MKALVAGYARTPFARFNGVLGSVPATELGGHAAAAALRRAGIRPDQVDRLVAGQVLQGGAGQNPARQTAVAAGIALNVPALTLNAVCLSGMEAVAEAARLVATGEADVVVAVGQESMTRAPHLFHGRQGQRYGALEVLDSLESDGLSDAFERRSMGASTEDGNTELGLDRETQDAWAARSHQFAAVHASALAAEIAPYTVASRRGETVVDADDGVRPDSTAPSLAGLRTAFAGDGTITAGNSSQISDGAAAVVVVSPEAAGRLGLNPLAVIESHALVAGPGVRLHAQPANAILAALKGVAAEVEDLAVVEINEAFAAVAVHSAQLLGVDPQRVNPRSGAIALGHPIGASGARIVGSLALQLAAKGPGAWGAAAICGGGGQGSAVVLRSV